MSTPQTLESSLRAFGWQWQQSDAHGGHLTSNKTQVSGAEPKSTRNMSTLQRGEHGRIDLALPLGELTVLAEENHTGARAAQRLVRSGRDDVAVLERGGQHLRGNQTTEMRH